MGSQAGVGSRLSGKRDHGGMVEDWKRKGAVPRWSKAMAGAGAESSRGLHLLQWNWARTGVVAMFWLDPVLIEEVTSPLLAF